MIADELRRQADVFTDIVAKLGRDKFEQPAGRATADRILLQPVLSFVSSIATEMRCPQYGPVYPRLRLNSAHWTTSQTCPMRDVVGIMRRIVGQSAVVRERNVSCTLRPYFST
jgi:hypothetical protein